MTTNTSSQIPWHRVEGEYRRSLEWSDVVNQRLLANAPINTQQARKAHVVPPTTHTNVSPSSASPQLREQLDVMRVNQLDAQQLDRELTLMLAYQLKRVLKYFNPVFLNTFKPELDAFLHLLIYRFSIYVDAPSPGNQLQNLRYRNELHPSINTSSSAAIDPKVYILTPRQKNFYALIFIGGRWFWTRFNQYMLSAGWASYPEGDWHHTCYEVCRVMENYYLAASVINFLVFLKNGRYRTLIDRLLGMRLVYLRSRVGRQVNFEYMNQQLVWHGFSEFLLFFMPLIKFEKIRGFFERLFRFRRISDDDVNAKDAPCPVCNAFPITTPYIASCGHRFCYYCLRASRLAERNYRCPRCNEVITSQTRLSVNDLPRPSSSGSTV